MNIMIITPIYAIKGRDNLYHDSSVIHYLVRPWAKEHKVKVFFIYMESVRRCGRFLNAKERKYYQEGYDYAIDNVEVNMCELLRLPKQKPGLTSAQLTKSKEGFAKMIAKERFFPDIIISHIPAITQRITDGIIPAHIPQIAVLHMTDVLYQESKTNVNDGWSAYNAFYARSRSIYLYFEKRKLRDLRREIIPSGVPSADVHYEDKRKPCSYSILYAGKLIPRKNIDIIIRALSLLKREYAFHLDIVGEGVDDMRLQYLAKRELNDGKCSYSFVGFLSRDEILKKMENVDVFVMPSRSETLGLVYLEAMSRGCIAIGSKGEGIDGVIINQENGFLVNPGDVSELCSVFRECFSMDDNQWNSIRKKAFETGMVYNEEDMSQKYLGIIRREFEWKNNCCEEQIL